MKILILSITAGQGHRQTGKAIGNYFEKNGHTAIKLDCYEYLSPILKEAVSSGYLVSTKYSPALYGKMYDFAEEYEDIDFSNKVVMGTNHLIYRKLKKYILELAPDAIICTHVFAAILMTYVKRKGIDIPTFGIITDFRLHPYWENSNIDYYVTANEFLEYSTVKKNIPKEKILPFGIPITENFENSMTKAEARAKLGLSDKKTVLIMGGSMGYGNIIKTLLKIDSLSLDLQIITVCGNNKRLYEEIENMEFAHSVKNYGYTNNVDELMDASDCIITKPGGLTVSESLAKKLPMILTKPIPGQEERNMDFLLNFGTAMKVSVKTPVDEVVYQLLRSEEKQNAMKNAMELIRRPESVKTLYNFILNMEKNLESEEN